MIDLGSRPSDGLTREYALILAVLDQALTDLLYRPAWKAKDPDSHWHISGFKWIQHRLNAYAWFFLEPDHEEAVFSYAWCCLHLDIAPEVLREKLRAEHGDLLEYLHRQQTGEAVTPALQAAWDRQGRKRANLTAGSHGPRKRLAAPRGAWGAIRLGEHRGSRDRHAQRQGGPFPGPSQGGPQQMSGSF